MSCRSRTVIFWLRYLKDGWRRLRVIPNGVDSSEFSPPPQPVTEPKVLFLGSFGHTPNLDACEKLLEDLWPEVRKRLPNARLSVVGAQPPDWVRRWNGKDGVTVVGTVPDVKESYRSHRVLVAPLRAGSGTRLKILEALASGLPVVSTTLGAEGLEVTNGHHLLVEDDPTGFVNCVTRLLTDDKLCAQLGAAGRGFVASRWDWDESAKRLLSTYRELSLPPHFLDSPGTAKRRRQWQGPREPIRTWTSPSSSPPSTEAVD